jgi:hypothetical protein
MTQKNREKQSSGPISGTGKARQKLYSLSLERVSFAMHEGYALEAICLLESMISDRLEARKAAIHGQKEEKRKFSTLKTLAQELRGKNSNEPEEVKQLYSRVEDWVDGRNSAIHEFAKLREGSRKKWETKYKEALKTATDGLELFRGLDKHIKKLNKATLLCAAIALFTTDVKSAPVNDNFYAATVIKGSSGSVGFDSSDSSAEAGEPRSSSVNSIWFSWTAPTSGLFSFTNANDNGSGLYIYTGNSVKNLTLVAGDWPRWRSRTAQVNFSFKKSITYFINVAGLPGTLSWSPITGPVNDNYASAFKIDGSSGTVSGTMTNAGLEHEEPGDGCNSIWYQWTAPFSGKAILDTLNTPDIYLGVYTGSAITNLNQVGYAGRSVEVNVVKGVNYFVRANAYSYNAAPTLALNWTLIRPPANDSFSAAAIITGALGTALGSTKAASIELLEPNQADNNQSVWYLWVSPFTGVVDFTTSGSSIYTTLTASDSADLDTLNVVGYAEGPPNTGAKSSFQVISGNSYRIAVSTFDEGDFSLSWSKNTNYVPSIISIVHANYNISEADGSVNITLNRNPGTDAAAVSCYIYTENASADGSDYSGLYTQISFANGATSASVSIPIFQDRRFEGEETFAVRLSQPSDRGAFGRSYATVNITDDEPFIPLKANYTGLIQTYPFDNDFSGIIAINATGSGSFSGRLLLGGSAAIPFKGTFSAAGTSSISIPRTKGGNVLLSLTYADNGNRIRTNVSSQGKAAEIQAWRVIFGGSVEISSKSFAFTAKIRGNYDAVGDVPKADGFLSINVSTTGLVKILGSLPDDTTITSSGQIAGYDAYPLYVSLYKNAGSLCGDLIINEMISNESIINWLKKPSSLSNSFKSGFAQRTSVETSPYIFNKRNPILADVLNTQGLAKFFASGPGLPADGASQLFRLLEDNSIALPLSPQIKLSLKFIPKSGFFTGTFQRSTEKATLFKGAVFQTLNSASGYFLSPNNNGILSNGTIDIGAAY